jgi:hypothetical protein
MIFRLTQKMAKKIKESPNINYSLAANPYTDWSAHLFTADRMQYLIITNTASLYSIISYARGMTDMDSFIKYSLGYMAEYLSGDGFGFQFRRLIVPNAKETVFSKLLDRRVISSINELIRIAKFYLIEDGLSPFDASQGINDIAMSCINYDKPKEAFIKMKPIMKKSELPNENE